MNKNIEIIGMIYKSVDYLEMMISELEKDYSKVDGWDVSWRILANDPNTKVLNYLNENNIPYTLYRDNNIADYYLNRVYRCWNYGVKTSDADNICFINSDMVFSENWLKNLLAHHDGINIPCSRLIESGKMPSGKYGVSHYFGHHPNNINYEVWSTDSKFYMDDSTHVGGLFMPCIFETERFIESGMYPEGNIYNDGIGTRNGDVIKSGDAYFFYDILEKKYGMKHITVFNSLVYHIQEGEKDE